MRGHEIVEAVSARLPEVAQSPTGTWYETTAAKVKSWYKQMHGGAPKLDADASVRYFVFVPSNEKLWSLSNKVLQFSHGDLGSVGTTGGFYTRMEADALQALVGVIQAKNGERIWGDFILYQGKVHLEHEFLATLPKVGEISTGAIHEVPADARWTLGRLYLKYQTSANRVLVFRNTIQDVSEPWSSVSIKDGVLSDMQSQRKLDKVAQVKLSKELAQVLGLAQKVTVNTHIIPESKLHDMLKAISDNPGVERWKLYWNVLKLKKLPKYRSPQDLASELVSMKLVQEVDDPVHPYPVMHITPMGKLVLARVNGGHNVSKVSLLK
jgi:hypothetical protein